MAEPTDLAKLPDRAELIRRLDRIDMSADVKAIVASLIDFTIETGDRLVRLGQQIVSFIFEFSRQYPSTAFGIAAALVISFLIGAIPGLGPMLSPFVTPLLLALGIGIGALDDMMDGRMRDRLSGLEGQIRDLGVS